VSIKQWAIYSCGDIASVACPRSCSKPPHPPCPCPVLVERYSDQLGHLQMRPNKLRDRAAADLHTQHSMSGGHRVPRDEPEESVCNPFFLPSARTQNPAHTPRACLSPCAHRLQSLPLHAPNIAPPFCTPALVRLVTIPNTGMVQDRQQASESSANPCDRYAEPRHSAYSRPNNLHYWTLPHVLLPRPDLTGHRFATSCSTLTWTRSNM
jgi:hypothetical protein